MIFSFLFLLIPVTFVIYYLITSKKNKHISAEMRIGEICYNCKSKIEISRNQVWDNIIDDKTHYTLCKSCQRDTKLNGIVGNKLHSKLVKFKLILLEDSKILTIYLLSIMVILLICHLLLAIIFHITWFNIIINGYLTLYWLMMLYRIRLVQGKKTQ